MSADEALKIIQQQAPCGHFSTDNSLGDGKTWAYCSDCGATVKQSSLARSRDSAQRFDDAVEHLRALCVEKTP
jgi:hypothetical protein